MLHASQRADESHSCTPVQEFPADVAPVEHFGGKESAAAVLTVKPMHWLLLLAQQSMRSNGWQHAAMLPAWPKLSSAAKDQRQPLALHNILYQVHDRPVILPQCRHCPRTNMQMSISGSHKGGFPHC